MTRLEWLWWYLTDRTPKRFGKRVRIGYFYDRYYNAETKKKFTFDKHKGKMLNDD